MISESITSILLSGLLGTLRALKPKLEYNP